MSNSPTSILVVPSTPSAPTPRKRGHVPTYGVGRTCAHAGCETTLSRYNDAPLCWSCRDTMSRAEGGPSR